MSVPEPLPPSLEALRARRRELAEQVAHLTFDLGGVTYEMAVRDHYRLDVLSRKAAELQAVDAELSEVQRVLAASVDGIAGACRSCGAVHSREAVFCWQCGQPILVQALPTGLVAGAAEDPPRRG